MADAKLQKKQIKEGNKNQQSTKSQSIKPLRLHTLLQEVGKTKSDFKPQIIPIFRDGYKDSK
ncbi:hypothetical protein ACLK1T_03325 [Escherichia coli]